MTPREHAERAGRLVASLVPLGGREALTNNQKLERAQVHALAALALVMTEGKDEQR